MSFTTAKNYTARAPLANAGEQMTAIMKWISNDAGPMIPVKTKEGLDLLNVVQKDLKENKFNSPLLRIGLDSGNLVLRVEGKPKYEKTTILVKGYEALKKEREKATVVNAHVGDSTIDSSSARMASAKGTTVKTAAEVDLNAKGSKAPIIILAHGSPSGGASGTVYAKNFAQKTPDDIVNFLVNEKKLEKNYAGVIYLDGCYTAAGPKQGRDPSELNNFAKKVYDKLLSKGYKYLQIKGNLGKAATMADGSEMVMDAQEEAAHKEEVQQLERLSKELRAESQTIKQRIEKLSQVAANLVAKHNGNAETLKADIGVKLVKEQVEKLEAERAAAERKLAAVDKDYVGKYMKDLVGVFGPAKLASEPWYKRLFG